MSRHADDHSPDQSPDAESPQAEAEPGSPIQPAWHELVHPTADTSDTSPTPSTRPLTSRIVSPRTVRVVAYAVGLALLIGGVAAVKVGHHDSDASAAASRSDQRASRDEVRPTALSSPTSTPTASPQPSLIPTPTALATSAPVVTTPPAPPPTPKKKTSTAKAPAAPAAGCGAYSGNRLIACNLLPSFGFSTSEMSALDPMWNNESGWNASAENPSSGAYGIPQSLPGSKMASAGSDWQTNPATQIKWGLDYIKQRYSSPSAAWSFWQANGWY